MKELEVENYLVEQVKLRGGMCEKFISPSRRGVPDRLITWPCGMMHLIETKAPGKKPNKHQVLDHAARKKLGVHVFVLATIEQVDDYLSKYDYLK